ncbi:hypothetical protein FPV67DRAFT_1485689 [Lyophyllum atratum]|nr:hypothetical protein FPV67DRAFT_1485689 [Lyophyllum atratum]
MSARQNKKQRKGRNNPNNRERTVTTLTEDPNTQFLIPTPSEEPAGVSLMSSPFSVASSSAGNAPSSSAYQPPSNYAAFGYSNSFGAPVHGPGHPQQHLPQQPPYFQPHQGILPPGRNDLEILENLKEIIKSNQHDIYRAIPQPAALASIYLGPMATPQAQITHHAEPLQYGNVIDGPLQASPTAGSGPPSPVELGRRPPRLQSKESWEASVQRKTLIGSTASGAQPSNNTNQPAQGYDDRYSQGNKLPTAIKTSKLGNGNANLAGPTSAGLKSLDVHMSDTPTVSTTEGPGPHSPRSARFESDIARPASGIPDLARVPVDRLGHGESGYGGPRGPGNISPDKSSFDGKDDLRNPRDTAWSARDGLPPSDDRRRDLDRPPPSPAPRPIVNGNGGGPDTRSNAGDRLPPLPRDDRYLDRDRERDREREYRDRRDWDRDRRPYDRFRGMSDARRPPPEQRHYEPDYDRPLPPRRYEVKEEPPSDARRLSDARPPPTLTSADDRAPVRPADDRLPPTPARVPPVSDSRPPIDSARLPQPDSRAPFPDHRVPSSDNQPVRGPSFDDRHVKPSPIDERRGAPMLSDIRAPTLAARPTDIPVASRPADDHERPRNPPAPPVEDRSLVRPQVPLEDRISRPSLQDRLTQPPVSRPEPSHATRQASLEERLSAIPVSADSREQRGRVPERDRVPPPRPAPALDSSTGPRVPPPAPPLAQDDRRMDDRPGRYTRPLTPPGNRALPPRRTPSPANRVLPSGRTPPPVSRAPYPPPRTNTVVDDPRAVKPPPSPPRSVARDYRPPPRPLSRERSGGSYRPDDRNYIPDDRRADAMDVDGPSRYSDGRPVPYNRPFSPPSAADLARDRARAQFPPSPPRAPAPLDAPPYDDDRRYAPGRDWSYQPSYSGDRRREWSAADDEYYKSRQWDRNAGPPPSSSASERDRFERDPLPPVRNNGWETRDERDRRDFAARAPSPPRNYDGPPRPLSSRLTDSYSTSAPGPGGVSNDRSYAPPPSRDAPPPMFSRVRQRSLSPVRRPGGPPVDDSRPPDKRPRGDGYAPDFYPPLSATSQSNRGDPGPPLRRPDSYPPLARGSSPPPSSGGSSYFDRSGPPPSSAGTAASAADRDYPPRDYPPPSYGRPRSPGPAGGYARGGYPPPRADSRDDRRYLPPPPPPSSMLPPPRRP